MRRWPGCLALALAAGCGGGERVAECDALLATVQKIGACRRLDATQRTQIDQAARSIADALDRLEDVGPDRAPPGLLDDLRRTCAAQDAGLRNQYQKVAPECVR